MAAHRCNFSITIVSIVVSVSWIVLAATPSISEITSVELEDSVFVVEQPKDVATAEGQPVTFACRFSASSPKCYWLRHDDPIDYGGRYRAIGDRSLGDCSLRIDRVVADADAGTWTCGYPRSSHSTRTVKSRPAMLNVTSVVEKGASNVADDVMSGSGDWSEPTALPEPEVVIAAIEQEVAAQEHADGKGSNEMMDTDEMWHFFLRR